MSHNETSRLIRSLGILFGMSTGLIIASSLSSLADFAIPVALVAYILLSVTGYLLGAAR